MAKAENFSVIGKRVQRVEGFDKVTGISQYIADIFLPGMLVGKALRSASLRTFRSKLSSMVWLPVQGC